MLQLTPLQLFKNLSDETRLGIVLLLREMGELCVCDLCMALINHSSKYPVIWRCYGKVESFWIVNRENGFTTAYHRIFLHGLPRLLSRPG